jgi:hypothetical protein
MAAAFSGFGAFAGRGISRLRRVRGAALRLAALVAAILFFARPAAALGTLTISKKDPAEVEGKWKLNMTLNYGSVPHLPHIPMIFSFTQTVHWERALTDKSPDKPVVVKTPLQNQQPINESMDVGFSDGSGKVFTTTKFDFVIRRDRGFEAGEYQLKIKRESDGVQIGQPQTITLNGDNAVVDRRAMVFSAEKKEKKPAADAPDKSAAGSSAEGADTKKADAPSAAETPPSGPEPGASEAGAEPPSVPPKQGGCGCRLAERETTNAGMFAFALGSAALLRRRRRRAASNID